MMGLALHQRSQVLTVVGYLKISILGLGISAFWGGMLGFVLPILLLNMVPEAEKNTYLGYLTLIGLMVAMLWQPIIGSMSDRSRFSWGRRRPFILVGILLAAVLLPGVGLWQNIAAVSITYCLLQIACNTAQATYQGFIPDLVPEDRRGTASAVKTIVELLGGFVFVLPVAAFMDRYSPGEGALWLWIALITLAGFLVVPAVLTVVTVKEERGTSGSPRRLFESLHDGFRISARRDSDFMLFLLSRGLMSIPGFALQTFVLYYVMDVLHVPNPAGMAARVMAVAGVSLMISTYLAGRLSDRIGRSPILVSSGIIGALGILFLYLSRSEVHLIGTAIVIGIANGAFWSTSWAQAIDMLPKGMSAKYLAFANLASVAGSILARLMGPMIDAFNTIGHNLGYSAMLIVSSACFIAGSVLWALGRWMAPSSRAPQRTLTEADKIDTKEGQGETFHPI